MFFKKAFKPKKLNEKKRNNTQAQSTLIFIRRKMLFNVSINICIRLKYKKKQYWIGVCWFNLDLIQGVLNYKYNHHCTNIENCLLTPFIYAIFPKNFWAPFEHIHIFISKLIWEYPTLFVPLLVKKKFQKNLYRFQSALFKKENK